jgi:hypothetical protein
VLAANAIEQKEIQKQTRRQIAQSRFGGMGWETDLT